MRINFSLGFFSCLPVDIVQSCGDPHRVDLPYRHADIIVFRSFFFCLSEI